MTKPLMPNSCIVVTAEEINALPDRIRQYICNLETDCDPSGTIRELAYAKDQIAQLTVKVATLLNPPVE